MNFSMLFQVALKPVCESELLKSAQETVQMKLLKGGIAHPANLSLDLLNNGLQSLASLGIIKKSRR